MVDNLIVFKSKNAPVEENAQEVWGDIKRQVYGLLLPKGISQQVADSFLDKFKPTFHSLIPPSIPLYTGKDESALMQAESASQVINDYVLKIIGSTCYRELMHFLEKEVKKNKADES